jgi:hypothetical protein
VQLHSRGHRKPRCAPFAGHFGTEYRDAEAPVLRAQQAIAQPTRFVAPKKTKPDLFRSRSCRLGSLSPTLPCSSRSNHRRACRNGWAESFSPGVCVRIESEGRDADAPGTICYRRQSRPKSASGDFVTFHLRRNYARAGKHRRLSTSDRQLLGIPNPRRETCPISRVRAAFAA